MVRSFSALSAPTLYKVCERVWRGSVPRRTQSRHNSPGTGSWESAAEELILTRDILERVATEHSAKQNKNIVLIICTCVLSLVLGKNSPYPFSLLVLGLAL